MSAIDIRKFKLSSRILLGLFLVYGNALAQGAYPGLSPVVQTVSPTGINALSAKVVPTTFTLQVQPVDPDGDMGRAVRYRTLIKHAVNAGGAAITNRTEFLTYFDEIYDSPELDWSPWQDVPAGPDPMELTLSDYPVDEYYLVSIQLLDQDGAANDWFDYQVSTFHFHITDGPFYPQVTVAEQFLGSTAAPEASSEIAAGQPLNFYWNADAGSYGSEIDSYRHGWDLLDVDDPNDPGWAVPPGVSAQNLFAPERTFSDGLHVFTVKVVDSNQQARVMQWNLRVVPFVDYNFQYSLMVLDQTVDSNSMAWVDSYGNPRDREDYRNAFWHFLAEVPGGVADMNWERDWFDHTELVSYGDVVNYRVVLCYARTSNNQLMFNQFRPVNGQDKFVWLAPYQERGGNLFLVGGHSMDSFMELLPNYVIPMIFDTEEVNLRINGQDYVAGFGTATMPDGTKVHRGRRMYPYATAGISALDWTSPTNKYIYGRIRTARYDRNVNCNGLKGLALDPDFKSYFGITGDAIADTIFSDPEIDWRDLDAISNGDLELFDPNFPFRRDEFVDANISATRPTPFFPQACDDGPNGMCIEPMFRGISRFDWIREYERTNGDPDWPLSQYSVQELNADNGCGPFSLATYQDLPSSTSRTNGQVYGYMSYKTVADKPSGKADVYWGFDPYRFDREESKKAIRWVLEYFGLQFFD